MDNTRQSDSAVFKRLRKDHGKAIADFGLIEAGDKIMVCLSGGKDSYAMLDLLLHSQRVAPIDFEIVAVNLDQKQPGFPEHVLPEYLTAKQVPFEIIQEDTYSIVVDKIPEGKTTCGLCSRLRRGILYKTANRLGANKIALGHHADDMLETLLLNLFFAGTVKSMPAKLYSDDGENIVIRPLAYCREKDIEQYAQEQQYPIIPCNLCGSQPNLQRAAMKDQIKQWEKDDPNRISSMLNALKNVVPSHMLDNTLYNFDDNTRNGNTTVTSSANTSTTNDAEFLGVPITLA